MLLPSDIEYQQTKLIKQQKRTLPSPFKELADWIAFHYSVQVLNIYYDTLTPDGCPRLNVILEFKNDALRFRDGDIGNYSESDQDAVREQFEKILASRSITKFAVADLLVIFSAFEPVALIDANQNISNTEIQQLETSLNNPDLWMISRCFELVTFFFYTDAQAKASEAAGLKQIYADAYFAILKTHDEFGYLNRNNFDVQFDSKENFDNNFQSSWFFYYR